MDLEALLALIANLATMTDDEVAQLAADLSAAAGPLAETDPTDEVLASLQSIADALAQIGTLQAERATDTADRAARQAALADSIAQIVTPDDGGDGGETADDTAGDAAAGDGADATAGADAAAVPEPVAAAGTRMPVATRVAARRPQTAQPAPATRSVDIAGLGLTAAGTFDTIQVGQPLRDEQDIARAFLNAVSTSRGYRGPRVKIPVVRSQTTEDVWQNAGRFLGSDPVANARLLRRNGLHQPGSLAAAGGICAPQQVNYDLPTIGVDARPVRDGAMARYGADRGGVRTLPVPRISDVDGAISIWDHDTDLDPQGETKDCLVIACDEDEDETLIEAIVRCLRTGNFRAKYFPEQIRAWLDLANVNQARRAENRLLANVASKSTNVVKDKTLGTTRDALTTLDLMLAGFASRWRDPNVQMRWVAPTWLRANMRVDIARQMPVGTTDETLAVADATIDRWFAARPNLSVTWHLDGESGQIFGAQGDGDVLGWPDEAISYLYPEGSWLFLDGGMLDFGIVRDSGLNAVNDFQMFAETMEGSHFHGIESFRIAHTICADGSASALVDIDPCTPGS